MSDRRSLLRSMFDAAIAAAQPSVCVPPYLPPVPKGRLIVIGAGKASAAMARAVEDHWPGKLGGIVVTRYGYAVRCERPHTRSLMPLGCGLPSAFLIW